MAGAWLSQHLYEHYLFGGDPAFLRDRAYPLMKGAAEFCLDWLVDDGQGPSRDVAVHVARAQVHHADGGRAAVSMASTMDLALIRDLFFNLIDAAKMLDIDDAVPRAAAQTALGAPAAVPRSAAQGQLLEWFQEFEDPEPDHRHFSHLFGLHPGPADHAAHAGALRGGAPIARAARRRRHGWSLAWKVNHWARLLDGDHAFTLLTQPAAARRHAQPELSRRRRRVRRTCSTRTRRSRSTATSA